MKKIKTKKPSIQKFVVISPQRSGTHLLKEYFNSHKNIFCARELLDERFRKEEGISLEKIFHGDFSQITDNKKEILMKGFISHPFQIKGLVLKKLKNMPSLKIIFLKRNNLLRRYISFRISEITKIYTSDHIKSNHTPPIISLTKEELIRDFVDTNYKFLKIKTILDAVHESVTTSYEELCENPKKVMEKIFVFIGAKKNAEIKTKYSKIETRKLSQAIENYATLKKEFKCTEWEKFFDE